MSTLEPPAALVPILPRATYEHGRFLESAVLAMPPQDRNAIDAWLVAVNHPLGWQASTQVQRIVTLAREFAGAKRSGPYCVSCRRFLPYEEVLPLKGKRKLAPVASWKLGDTVGRCPRHQQSTVALVKES